MTARHVAVDLLLWVGVGLELVSCIGMLAFASIYDRLHLASPAALGVVFIAAAVVVQKSFSLVGDKALLIAAFTLAGGPLVTHAFGRAARVLEHGEWRLQEHEAVEVEQR